MNDRIPLDAPMERKTVRTSTPARRTDRWSWVNPTPATGNTVAELEENALITAAEATGAALSGLRVKPGYQVYPVPAQGTADAYITGAGAWARDNAQDAKLYASVYVTELMPEERWVHLRRRVEDNLRLLIAHHSTSVSEGSEDITAYAMADAMSAVRSWITELEDAE